MDGAHLHLLVNHVPILGSVFALLLLLASLAWAPDALRRTAFVVLIATGIAAFMANQSGEPAEDAIRSYPGVLRDVIHEHEEMGETAFIAAGILGVLALGAVVRWRRTPVPRGVTYGMLLGTVVVAGLMGYTGLLGGRIRHTEVRPGATDADATVIEPRRQRPAEAPEAAP